MSYESLDDIWKSLRNLTITGKEPPEKVTWCVVLMIFQRRKRRKDIKKVGGCQEFGAE